MAAGLWQTATGEGPEIDENRPREGIRRQGGPFEGCYLGTTIASERIDWVLAPRIDPLAPPFYDSFSKAMGDFAAAGQKWLAIGSPSTYRLAVGAVLLMPAASTKAAYQKLDDMLVAVHVDPDHSSDFFYQINWPRASGVVPQLRLNRLTRWTTAVRSVKLQMDGNSASVRSNLPGDENYCRLECDHSTPPDHTEPFTPIDLVEKLFQELCGMVRKCWAGRGHRD